MNNISATNRGSKRIEADFYATPIKDIHKFLDFYPLQEGNILEPSAGNGNFVKVLRERESRLHITSVELRQEEFDNLNTYSDEVIIGDFLNLDITNKYKTIIGNPPYSLAIEFVEKCLDLLEDEGELILLLRTAFLESKKRHDFWKRNPLNGLYVLSQRPSFTGNGKSDATSYSWFVWKKEKCDQVIDVI